MTEHRRIVYPMPIGQHWPMKCTCGWEHRIDLAVAQQTRPDKLLDLLDAAFVEHLTSDQRETYVKVDRRPGYEGAWIMPAGIPCSFSDWYEEDDVYYAHVVQPVVKTLPIGDLFLEDGRNFRMA